jgi:hypothetical protein
LGSGKRGKKLAQVTGKKFSRLEAKAFALDSDVAPDMKVVRRELLRC